MKSIKNTYPVFEANQILSNVHLNSAFDFSNEQERLSRANLIGIGIVCGLEVSLDTEKLAIQITKGCGISSEGYLIVQPNDVILGRYKDYQLPQEKDAEKYAPFLSNKTQYELLEIVPDDDDNRTSSTLLTADDLTNKVVLLFLELKKDNLRSCSANSCDDRGSKVTATLRPLLIAKNDLEIITANIQVNKEASSIFFDREAVLAAQLNLPDFRLPRYELSNDRSIESEDILAAFHAVFSRGDGKLATQIGDALSQAYLAFKPVIQDLFPDNPFASFNAKFGFLDDLPVNVTQVRFLQYYYDLFDDLIKAYDEFRWKGVALLCSCCPPDALFPRHLILGLAKPSDSKISLSLYRHYFTPSPASNSCEARFKERAELKLLFRRLVEMVEQFTDTPNPPLDDKKNPLIRITPSKLGDVPLSDKAIPYYYQQSGEPQLFTLWNIEKNLRNRARQNLSYRGDEYPTPVPDFVINPLHYDLEPYNFLRIEGHLGTNYQDVTQTLLDLKKQYRLPIEVIALRSGRFTEQMLADLSQELNQEDCRFEDLEAQYDVLKGELICFLCKEVQFFYDIPSFDEESTVKNKPTLPLLVKQAPDYEMKDGSFGLYFEELMIEQFGGEIPNLDSSPETLSVVIKAIFAKEGASNDDGAVTTYAYIVVLIGLSSKIYENISSDLSRFNYDNFEKRHNDLVDIATMLEHELKQFTSDRYDELLEDVDDRLEAIIYACHLDAFKVLYDEYLRRVHEIKEKLFLNHFLESNPGIQHKAGVPLGGTFILVYHIAPKDEGQKIAPDIINQTVKELADNTVIADFYLPYQCNSVCEAVQFVLPKILPKLFVKIGCTNEQGFATVSLTVKGGLPPYDLKIDKQDYQPLSPTVSLAVGSHILRICDAEGTESLPQTITIVSPITFSEPSFQCSADISAYRATFTIFGGTPPYTVNEITITGNVYTTDSIDNGTTKIINVLDSRQCAAELEITHTCVQPTFTVTIGCSNADGASVNIIPEGDLSLYTIKIDDGEYQALVETLGLAVGEHSVTIRDAEGSESLPQTITVASPITFSERIFQYDEASDTYTATFNILGGTPPYTVNDADGETVTDSVYTTTSIVNGTERAITVMDSRSCPAEISFNETYVTFSAIMDCPNADSFSSLNIIPKGGLSPYEIKINEQDYQALNEISLRAGEYTLIVHDADGKESLPQTITVASVISFDSVDFKCSDDLQTYTATIMLSGGKPPYTINGVPFDGNNSYTTDSIASKASVSINVLDSNQCPANIEISHNCCDLPCDGIALRRGYYFSLPEAEVNPQVRFVFEYPQNNRIDLSENVQKLLQEVAGDGFSFAEKLNALIVENTKGIACLIFTYEPSTSGFMDTWWIEHFECLAFELTIRGFFSNERFLIFSIAPAASVFPNPITASVPAFDGIKINKCNPKAPIERMCAKELDLKLEIVHDFQFPDIFLTAQPSGNEEPIFYLWEVQRQKNINPIMKNGQKVFFTLGENIKTINVRLTAFTKNVCRVVLESTIDFG
jgi:hypothetical protein